MPAPSFSIKQGQIQSISPKMLQSLHILQMGREELYAYIQEQAMENPLIDLEGIEQNVQETAASMPREEWGQAKTEWLEHYDVQDRVYYQIDDAEQRQEPWDHAKNEICFSEYLASQYFLLVEDAADRRAMDFLAASLDERGYLTENPDTLAALLGCPEKHVRFLIALLQSLEPAGVGARDSTECLLLQIRRRAGSKPPSIRPEDAELLEEIITRHLPALGKNRFSAIAKALGRSMEETRRLCALIRSLNPIPANAFSTRETLRYLKPDVTVVKFPGYFEVIVNGLERSEITVNPDYLILLHQDMPKETYEYVRQKYEQVQWINSCIRGRNHTLKSVVTEVVKRQIAFFDRQDGRCVPLRLSDIAKTLSLSESTVSRTVKDKFIQCQRGLFPLSYFFPEKLSDGQAGTAEDAKERIAELIRTEDRQKPLSDQKIAQSLALSGISLSRRTVAKYRGQLGIPDASGRRLDASGRRGR